MSNLPTRGSKGYEPEMSNAPERSYCICSRLYFYILYGLGFDTRPTDWYSGTLTISPRMPFTTDILTLHLNSSLLLVDLLYKIIPYHSDCDWGGFRSWKSFCLLEEKYVLHMTVFVQTGNETI